MSTASAAPGRAGASGLAVTLVTRDDTRLMADIEKLIKTKIELEALELDDAPPRREPRERLRRDAVGGAGQHHAHARPCAQRRSARRVIRFFEQPYVAASDASPVWEKSAATPVARALSPNIKPKKKLAALFGAKSAESSPGQQ